MLWCGGFIRRQAHIFGLALTLILIQSDSGKRYSMAKKNYNDNTIKFLRDQGFIVGRVETYIKHPGMKFGKRRDLFGIIDYIAIAERIILGVQSTGYSGKSSHKKTILESGLAKEWIKAGGELVLITWRKKQIGRKLYHPDVMTFTEGLTFHQQDWRQPIDLQAVLRDQNSNQDLL